jgi:hypothetical protein
MKKNGESNGEMAAAWRKLKSLAKHQHIETQVTISSQRISSSALKTSHRNGSSSMAIMAIAASAAVEGGVAGMAAACANHKSA